MVAYNFQRRFAPAIAGGCKTHTIRPERRRHARPGEMLQLFTGMRSTSCVKIIPDPLCLRIEPVRIDFDAEGKIDQVQIDGQAVEDLDQFALADGFESLADMSGFWTLQHGLLRAFEGVLIGWAPVAQRAWCDAVALSRQQQTGGE